MPSGAATPSGAWSAALRPCGWAASRPGFRPARLLPMECVMRFLFAINGIAFLASAVNAGDPANYVRDVRPIFAKHCYACHGPDKQRAGLRLDTGAAALKGGDSGAVIVPGKAEQSKLIKAVRGAADVKAMPEKGDRLSAKEIAVLAAWIDQGAKVPANEVAGQGATQKKHWAFVAPVRPTPPSVKNTAWVRN